MTTTNDPRQPAGPRPSRSSRPLTDDEIWSFVTGGDTAIMTTLRRDGMPITLPLWFARVDRTMYAHTRGKKLRRLARDRRASALVESGEAWVELKAVRFTPDDRVLTWDNTKIAQATR